MGHHRQTVTDHYVGKTSRHAMEAFKTLLADAETQASSKKEMDFVSDMKERFERYGSHTMVSRAQFDWLCKIGGYGDDCDPEDDIRSFKDE